MVDEEDAWHWSEEFDADDSEELDADESEELDADDFDEETWILSPFFRRYLLVVDAGAAGI